MYGTYERQDYHAVLQLVMLWTAVVWYERGNYMVSKWAKVCCSHGDVFSSVTRQFCCMCVRKGGASTAVPVCTAMKRIAAVAVDTCASERVSA